MTTYYSPHTGEIINTTDPAPWMGQTAISPPAYNAATESVFFVNGAWAVSPNDPALTAELQAKALHDYQQSAKSALDATDITLSRILEAVILGKTTFSAADVVAWATYRKALRSELVANAVGTLPAKPAYPVGT